MSKSARLLRDIFLILVGSAAGIYALLQARQLSTLSQSGGRASDAASQAYTTGTLTGSVIGLVLGGVVCLVCFWVAFRKRKKSAGGKGGQPVGRRAKGKAGDGPEVD